MKTILLILITAFGCKAQNVVPVHIATDELIAKSILIDMMEYKIKCFNDSTRSDYQRHRNDLIHSMYSTGDPVPCTCPMVVRWTRKNPTFEGYMDFLITKYGSK